MLNLIGNHPDRVKRNAPDTSSVAGEVMVEAVIAYPGARIDELISLLDYVQSQSGVKTGVIVVCDRRFYQTNQPIIDEDIRIVFRRIGRSLSAESGF